MDKTSSKTKTNKGKTKKPAAKPKPTKKRKSDGPTCSMFLAELTKKLKKRQEEEATANIVQTIIDSLTNALPDILTKKSTSKKESPVKLEELTTVAPELLPNETFDIMAPSIEETEVETVEGMIPTETSSIMGFKMPRMPVVSSEVFKKAALANRAQVTKEDIQTMTGGEVDVASEIAKHVNTLRKISLIAEEFNQKTAKNLKEIVDSVQEDLVKKLHEIQAEQKVANEQKDATEK